MVRDGVCFKALGSRIGYVLRYCGPVWDGVCFVDLESGMGHIFKPLLEILQRLRERRLNLGGNDDEGDGTRGSRAVSFEVRVVGWWWFQTHTQHTPRVHSMYSAFDEDEIGA